MKKLVALMLTLTLTLGTTNSGERGAVRERKTKIEIKLYI